MSATVSIRADVVICIGFDMVEYQPKLWHPRADKKIIHIDQTYAEVDSHYLLEVGVIGEIGETLDQIARRVEPEQEPRNRSLARRHNRRTG